ncbi:MAG: thiamine phosphate synthase [Acidobacteriia bacterium]|nr:thiamine phosphate synthase [Terriglobia bacterium]
MLLYYITDRTAFPGDEPARRHRLLDKIADAARCGVDLIQLREKDLSTRDLESLAAEAVCTVRQAQLATGNRELTTLLLVNSRGDVAVAVGADGVHLRSSDISAADARAIWKSGAGALARVVVAVSCHSADEVAAAQAQGADFAVFAPVFEKKDAPAGRPTGLEALHHACRQKIPLLALGGVTLDNARACLEAGAAGIAGIRLFQENNIAKVVSGLRALLPGQ